MDKKQLLLKDAAEMVSGELSGDGGIPISDCNSIEAATSNDITFLAKASEWRQLVTCRAGAVLVPLGLTEKLAMPTIAVKNPYLASAIIHNHLLSRPFQAAGIHPRAFVDDDCEISELVTIGPMAVIGKRVQIGERVDIGAGTVIGDDVVIGNDTTLKANVTIAEGCILGNKVTIHSGTVIGSDGYGYATDELGNHVKRPQVGAVRIDDDVEIGSNVSVDRGAFADTRIHSGVKIDNLVQVAHNVVIGPNSLIVSQAGLSGSTVLGRNVVLGGKSSVVGHLKLGDGAMVAGGGGVTRDLDKGERVGGLPAIGVRNWAKSSAIFAKLPEIYADLRKLKKTVAALQKQDK